MASRDNNIRAKLGNSLLIHENLKQHAWVILEDKVRLTLIEYEKQFEKSSDWKSPFSVMITLIVTIATSKFEDFYFIPADTLTAMFYFATLFFMWQTFIKAYYSRRQKKISIDDVIQELRESSEQQKSESRAD